MHDDLAGRTLAGRYDVLAPLGSGGMGSVYRARDRELDEEIALKVIHRDLLHEPSVLERFRREVKLARRVTHRNVARTYELNRAGDIAFCTMELVEGESLRARLEREKQVATEEAIAIARALCDGLAAAHAVGVIHRDIKPENVLIAHDGRVVLADFGVAAATFADSNEVSGTLAYMAPEQSRGEPPTPETDVYALAVVIFEMVSGRVPFRGAPLEVVMAKQETPHLQLEGGGRDLALVVARATALDRSARIRTASQLGQLLATLASAAPSAPPIGSATGYEVRTVIVLPPRATASVEHLALALHEAVLARLGRVPRVRALARTSATAEPAQSVVELVVDEVVSATITRPGGAPLMLRLPSEVGELDATADAIAGLVASTVDQVPAQIAPQDARAIGQMLRARARMQRGFEGTAEVLAMLESANELSPGDPRIVASLAFAEVRCAFFFDEASADHLSRARGLVGRALASGSTLPESHLAAGHLELHTGHSVRAARHFRDAIACGPQVAEAHEHIGRMLLEAGFLDVGLARIEDALAIAPTRGTARWDLARAWALEGRWDDCDRLAADLVAEKADRWITRVRFAWWRRDEALLAKVFADPVAGMARRTDVPRLFATIVDTVLQHNWLAQRDAIVAMAATPSASARRQAFNAQLAAEIAGYFGDAATCVAMIERAASCGAFDLHWLDRCTLLDVARGPAIAAVRGELARRASSILDAMYGDAESIDTVFG